MTIHQEIKQLINTGTSKKLAIISKPSLNKLDMVLETLKKENLELYNKLMGDNK